MTETGLTPVKNPSELLLADKGEPTSGSVITCLLEGNRPMLVEIQALVTKTSFGYPVRKASGFDVNRLHLLVAVLQKRTNINLAQYDVHINVVGGVDADEPAADLAVCFAIASSYNDKPVANDLCVFGEVGLSGDIRSVTHIERRLKECVERGMKRIITKTNTTHADKKLQVVSVKNIQDLTQQTK
jgi:DNA repair protein RadA/Sms